MSHAEVARTAIPANNPIGCIAPERALLPEWTAGRYPAIAHANRAELLAANDLDRSEEGRRKAGPGVAFTLGRDARRGGGADRQDRQNGQNGVELRKMELISSQTRMRRVPRTRSPRPGPTARRYRGTEEQ